LILLVKASAVRVMGTNAVNSVTVAWNSWAAVVTAGQLGQSLQTTEYAFGNHFRQLDGHGVSELPHAFRPRTHEHVIVRERLQTGAFSHSEITDFPIGIGEHVLAAWHSVIAGLEYFGWLIKWTASVTSINTRSRIEPVIRKH
jgi:hypothetical protein